MITAIAIDDEPPALEVVRSFCERTDLVSLQKTFTRPNEALKHLRKFPVDLLFLDINMPSMTGIEFFNLVEQNTMVIFTTAHSQYAVEGFNLSAVDFLLKPFTFERFMQAVNKANEYYNFQNKTDNATPAALFVRADYSLVKINLSDIHFVEGLDDYLKIHLSSAKKVVTRMTMKSILEKLPANEFIRVHRSFIVPLKKIESVRNKIITIGGEEIPIGLSYEQQFFEKFGE
jgi:DNA-binding LytR/AlgR family response regulator